MAHVPFLHDVVTALGAQAPGRADVGLGAVLGEIRDRVDLCADEGLLEVGVDHAGGLGRLGAGGHGPGADLLLARRVVGLQAEELVGGLDEAVEAELGDPEVLHEDLTIALVHVP